MIHIEKNSILYQSGLANRFLTVKIEVNQPFTTLSKILTMRNKALANVVGKGEDAGYYHFLQYPECFIPF